MKSFYIDRDSSFKETYGVAIGKVYYLTPLEASKLNLEMISLDEVLRLNDEELILVSNEAFQKLYK